MAERSLLQLQTRLESSTGRTVSAPPNKEALRILVVLSIDRCAEAGPARRPAMWGAAGCWSPDRVHLGRKHSAADCIRTAADISAKSSRTDRR